MPLNTKKVLKWTADGKGPVKVNANSQETLQVESQANDVTSQDTIVQMLKAQQDFKHLDNGVLLGHL